MRIPQPEGKKGSLKWIQRAIETSPDCLQPSGLPSIDWVSPLKSDQYAEYRDGSFLDAVGLSPLRENLQQFWPSRGPQWDALGVFDEGVVLVEAKAHIAEFFTSGTAATQSSLLKIERALSDTQSFLNAAPKANWTQTYYQYANRLTHLYFLRQNGVNAHLLFVSFLNNTDMKGPMHAETWDTAFLSANYALGIPNRHKLSKFIHHQCPDVSSL